MKIVLKALLVAIAALLLLGAPTMATSVKITVFDRQAEILIVTNTDTGVVDLTGWKITDEGEEHTFTFPSGFTLRLGGSVVIASGPNQFSGIDFISWTKADVWNDEGDVATLWDSNGTKVDASLGIAFPDDSRTVTTTIPTTIPGRTSPSGTPIALPTAPVLSTPSTLPIPIMPIAPLPTSSRFGIRQYVVGTVPLNPQTGISRGSSRSISAISPGTTIGTGVATGMTPPSSRFVRWSPIVRWRAEHGV